MKQILKKLTQFIAELNGIHQATVRSYDDLNANYQWMQQHHERRRMMDVEELSRQKQLEQAHGRAKLRYQTTSMAREIIADADNESTLAEQFYYINEELFAAYGMNVRDELQRALDMGRRHAQA